MPDIKLGSLFDGIGVFPLAASRCGIRPVWASEIEKAPISITKRHFPDMVHLGDITKVDGGKIPPVHIITFGSPCQNLSLIGNRSGLAGAKSSLFYQAFRIIQEMRDATDNLYPAIAVWENVMGAFSTNDRMDFRAVLSAFSDTEVPMPPSGRWGNAGMVRGGTPDVCWRLMDAQYWAGSRRLKDLINLTQNLDLYRFYPDISDDEGLGRLYADELGTIDIPEHIQNYFDYEAYGRDVRINEGGVFASGGYVSAVPEGFKEYYHGPQDIPPEHRIFAYPEKAEPVHSILATLKRFQEAPPAPKKDKAGPSHEERFCLLPNRVRNRPKK